MCGLPWSGRLAVLPLFIALVVYGSVKNSGGVGREGKGTNWVLTQRRKVAEMHREGKHLEEQRDGTKSRKIWYNHNY
jgi:hypothetical protein